ncbi:PREDICTED: inositol 2-dehydrogenase-like isoform X2 [Cyprinodon variegatus]|uniref:inositol 2-dehydrogenase-like isoform X2 n=1 Tax=Cyprinodon variegatus TaxID=28743 RepID=UPI000742A0C8|nr:PREDICTED: inositol 2-dehydrogenase-like isoform X2 [Cyprinodon variegatus]
MGQNRSQESKMTSPVRVIVVGAGCRGAGYAQFATIHPKRMKVVAVADPRKFARTKLQKQHKIEDQNIFEDWQSIAELEKFADAVLICTPDRIHKDPAVAFAKKGYHILLEKPMATSAEECRAIVEACTQAGVMLSVGHVLRYDPLIHEIKVLIDAGAIGDVIHIQHLEPVGFYHFAHSFVRGNWRNEAESSFALLAKSCHDIDLIHHWAGARRCVKVSSFGSVSHFRKEKKPTGAGDRCIDCSVEGNCPYSACKIYLNSVKKGHTGWPVSVICPNSVPDIESVTEALKTGPYGRCVYDCDNDVCSNQGELSYNGSEIRVFDFLTQRSTKHTASWEAAKHYGMSGHGGADYHLINTFISAVANNDPSMIRSGPEETLISHLLVFEAERSRVENRVVYCGDGARS